MCSFQHRVVKLLTDTGLNLSDSRVSHRFPRTGPFVRRESDDSRGNVVSLIREANKSWEIHFILGSAQPFLRNNNLYTVQIKMTNFTVKLDVKQ